MQQLSSRSLQRCVPTAGAAGHGEALRAWLWPPEVWVRFGTAREWTRGWGPLAAPVSSGRKGQGLAPLLGTSPPTGLGHHRKAFSIVAPARAPSDVRSVQAQGAGCPMQPLRLGCAGGEVGSRLPGCRQSQEAVSGQAFQGRARFPQQ